jgi:hypothetical protein
VKTLNYLQVVIRACTISIALVMLLGSIVDLHDLSKLPYMIKHYQQHKHKEQVFSFTDFLDLHYGGQAEKHDKQEHEKHKGLPFKNHDCTAFHGTSVLHKFEPSIISIFTLTISYSNFYQSVFSSEFRQSIWQPPKVC